MSAHNESAVTENSPLLPDELRRDSPSYSGDDTDGANNDDRREISGPAAIQKESQCNGIVEFLWFIPWDYILVSGDGKAVAINNDVLSSMFLLLNIMLGTGIVFQAYVVAQAGVLLTVAVYIIVCIISYFSCVVLLEASSRTGIYSFGTLCEVANGHWALLLLEWSIVLSVLFETVVYFILIGQMLRSLFTDSADVDAWYINQNLLFTLVSLLVVLPLCLIRRVGHMTWYAYYSQSVVCILVILLMVLAVIRLADGTSVFEDNASSVNLGSFTGLIRTIGNIVFAVYVSFGFLHVERAMAVRKDKKLVKHVTMATIILGGAMLFTVGLAGYIAFGNNAMSNVIDNLGHRATGDVMKVLFTLHLALYIPAEFAIMRSSFTSILGIDVEQEENVEYLICTVGSMLVVVIVTILLNIYAPVDVYQSLVNLIGGLCGVVQTCVSPGLIALTLLRDQRHYTIGGVLLVLSGVLIAAAVIGAEVMKYL